MGESMYALYTSKEQEVKRLEQATDNHGFMKAPSIFGSGADNICYPFNKITPVYPPVFSPRIQQDSPAKVIKERISSLVSAADYQILVRTTYTSPKEQINRYIEILINLMKSGVFNIIDEKEDMKPNIPITDPQNSVVSNLGTIVRPADDDIVLSNTDNNICDCSIENNNKCCATELLDRRTKEYKNVVEAMNKLKEACSAAGISMITAVQAADKKDQSK